MFPYIACLVFWIGVIVLQIPQKEGLSQRLKALSKKGQNTVKSSWAFQAFTRLWGLSRRNALSRELAECLAYIKNVVILGQSSSVSAQILMEDLSELSDKLKPAFVDMAKYINMNEKEAAAECLEKYIGTDMSYAVGTFIAGWDDLPPEDILDTVDAYQSSLREERITAQRRKDEVVSDLIYFPVVLNCMVVLLNFIYIAYFIEQKLTLSILF